MTEEPDFAAADRLAQQILDMTPESFTDAYSQLARAYQAARREIERLKRSNEIRQAANDRWVPCPDHRDKVNWNPHEPRRCQVCRAEAAELALLAAQEQARRDAAVIEAAEEVSDAFAGEIRGEYAKQLSRALLGLRTALAARKEPGHG